MRYVKKWYSFSLAICAGMIILNGCKSSGGEEMSLMQTEIQEQIVTATEQEKENEEFMAAEQTGENITEPEPEAVDIPADDFTAWNKLLEENECSKEFMQALTDFSYRSASQVLAQEEGNGNFSPLSLYYALALAESGAEKETDKELLSVLGMESKEELSEACRKLYQQLYYREKWQKERMSMYGEMDVQAACKLRNSLWLSNAFSFRQEYSDRAAGNFYASVHPVDFALPETGKAMGQWVSDQTNGVLAPELMIEPTTALCILNTLYFYGGWEKEFPKEQTKTEEFTLADGTTTECSMMNRSELMGTFRKGDGYTLSCLYTNNDCRMVILLPDRDRTEEEFLQDKDKLAESLGAAENMDNGSWQMGKVVWKMPKFSFGSSYSLESSLSQMGIQQMFDRQKADFSGISPEKPLWVSQVIQESHIGVDENGVEGAAYTMMALAAGAVLDEGNEVEMFCDRPFIYGIQDCSSKAWLFIGVCREPGEE